MKSDRSLMHVVFSIFSIYYIKPIDNVNWIEEFCFNFKLKIDVIMGVMIRVETQIFQEQSNKGLQHLPVCLHFGHFSI